MKKAFLFVCCIFVAAVCQAQVISTIAGGGPNGYSSTSHSGYGGQATAANFANIYGIATDPLGNLYIADLPYSYIHKVNAAGILSRFAGTYSFSGSLPGFPTIGYSGDGGAATSALLHSPESITVDINGNVYIADKGNYRVRKVSTSGIISTIAGTGISGYSGDGAAATAAQLALPTSIATDLSGNIYITDSNRLRKISTSGTITTICGTGIGGYNGDGGQATAAMLNRPVGVSIDYNGNVYIADGANFRMRKIDNTGIISTIAGTGVGGSNGDGGPATAARININSILADLVGNVYFSDYYKVRKVNAAGTISTVAGNGTSGSSGDGGNATSAQIYEPKGLAVDTLGNLYIADMVVGRVRKVALCSGPTVTPISGALSVCVGGTISLGNATPGGVWTSSLATRATISSAGVVSGISIGNTVVSYTVTNACRSTVVTSAIAVGTVPLVNNIAGPATMCSGSVITLSNTTAGGVWSSSDATVATVNSAGVVLGITPGTAAISYSVANTCGTTYKTKNITNIVVPVGGPLSGPTQVYTGSNIALVPPMAGGIWRSSMNAVAIVAGGNVGGVAFGTAVISYSMSNACGSFVSTQNVTVSGPSPSFTAGVTANMSACENYFTAYNIDRFLQVWDSSTGRPLVWRLLTYPAHGSVTLNCSALTNGGLVSLVGGAGQYAPNANYTGMDSFRMQVTNGIDSNSILMRVTVKPAPPISPYITGPSLLCVGGNISLEGFPAGGSFFRTSAHVAVSLAGVVTASSPGNAFVIYSVGVLNGCSAFATFPILAVSPIPGNGIVGLPLSLCPGATVSLSGIRTGGSWSTIRPEVSAVSPTGVLTAVSSGVDTVMYTLNNVCGLQIAQKKVSVLFPSAIPAIGGSQSTICPGATVSLTNSAIGGIWSNANPTIANVSATGVVTGIAAGVDTVKYTKVDGCGFTISSKRVVTVKALPNAGIVSGPATMLANTNDLVTTTGTGGSWSSTNTAIATVGNTGTVRARMAGTDTIKYTVTNACGTAVAIHILSVAGAKGIDAGVDGMPVICTAIKAYPNPTAGRVTIELPYGEGTNTIYITDIAGRTAMLTETSDRTIDVDLNSYSAGIYMLRIISGKRVYEVKVQKD